MQLFSLQRYIFFDFTFKKQIMLGTQFIYFLLWNIKNFQNKKFNVFYQTQTVFFDIVFLPKQLNFFKMGGNLDSLVKTQTILIYKKVLTSVLFIFDKYSVVYLIKKTTENSWTALSPSISKLRRNFLGIFKLFWYAAALLFFFIFFI